MLIYNYNIKGVYLNSEEADESPLEEGVYLIPANATIIKPPTVKNGFMQVFNGTEWNIKPIPVKEPEPMQETPIITPVPTDNSQSIILELQTKIDTLQDTLDTQGKIVNELVLAKLKTI